MALSEWQPWHIGVMWVLGLIVLGLLLRRIITSFSGVSATGGMSGFSVSVVPGLFAVLVVVGLVAVTIGWIRRAG